MTIISPAPVRHGYLAATIGGATGATALGGAGVAVGLAVAEMLSDPAAGLGDLALLLWPIVLGGLGLLAGVITGTTVGLAGRGHHRAAATGAVAGLLAAAVIVCMVVGPGGPVWLVMLVACPPAARRAVADPSTATTAQSPASRAASAP